jgi:hypothetical protein
MNPDTLKQKINSLQQVWDAQTKQYVNTYPDKKFGSNTILNQRSFNNLVNSYSKMVSLDAQLQGLSTGVNQNLKMWDNKLESLKNSIGSNKQSLMNELGNNTASGRMRTDKYNSNSETYIQASFYILALSTMTFFIYKQLKH